MFYLKTETSFLKKGGKCLQAKEEAEGKKDNSISFIIPFTRMKP